MTIYLFAAIAVLAAFAALGAVALTKLRPAWSSWRISMAAATPLPGAMFLFSAWIAVKSSLTPVAKCGVDACGMAIVVAMGLAVVGVVRFAFSVMIARYTLRRVRA